MAVDGHGTWETQRYHVQAHYRTSKVVAHIIFLFQVLYSKQDFFVVCVPYILWRDIIDVRSMQANTEVCVDVNLLTAPDSVDSQIFNSCGLPGWTCSWVIAVNVWGLLKYDVSVEFVMYLIDQSKHAGRERCLAYKFKLPATIIM